MCIQRIWSSRSKCNWDNWSSFLSFSTSPSHNQHLFFILFIYLFIYLLAMLGLHCCMWTFSSCGKQGLLCIAVSELLIAVASRWGTWAVGTWASVVAAHGLSSCSVQVSVVVACGLSSCGLRALEHKLSSCGVLRVSCSAACGIFPDQGSNLCPLHWQADF